jgi:hypothetical protein
MHSTHQIGIRCDTRPVSDAIQARSYTGHIFALPLHVKKVGFDW